MTPKMHGEEDVNDKMKEDKEENKFVNEAGNEVGNKNKVEREVVHSPAVQSPAGHGKDAGERPGKLLEDPPITLRPPLHCPNPRWVFLVFYIATMVCVLLGWIYYYLVQLNWWVILLLPLEFLGIAYAFIMTSLFLVKIAVSVLDRRYPPEEGLFPVNGPEMRAYRARQFFKFYAIWLARNSTFPWIDKIAYTMLGVPVGKTVVLHEAWVDTELVEIGDFVMVGMNSMVLSHMLVDDHVLVKKVYIGDHSVIGAYTILVPGVRVGKSCVIGANSTTRVDQVIEDRFLYAGDPARKLKEIE